MFNDDSSAELKVVDNSLYLFAMCSLHLHRVSLSNIFETFQELWIVLAVRSADFGENCR